MGRTVDPRAPNPRSWADTRCAVMGRCGTLGRSHVVDRFSLGQAALEREIAGPACRLGLVLVPGRPGSAHRPRSVRLRGIVIAGIVDAPPIRRRPGEDMVQVHAGTDPGRIACWTQPVPSTPLRGPGGGSRERPAPGMLLPRRGLRRPDAESGSPVSERSRCASGGDLAAACDAGDRQFQRRQPSIGAFKMGPGDGGGDGRPLRGAVRLWVAFPARPSWGGWHWPSKRRADPWRHSVDVARLAGRASSGGAGAHGCGAGPSRPGPDEPTLECLRAASCKAASRVGFHWWR